MISPTTDDEELVGLGFGPPDQLPVVAFADIERLTDDLVRIRAAKTASVLLLDRPLDAYIALEALVDYARRIQDGLYEAALTEAEEHRKCHKKHRDGVRTRGSSFTIYADGYQTRIKTHETAIREEKLKIKAIQQEADKDPVGAQKLDGKRKLYIDLGSTLDVAPGQ